MQFCQEGLEQEGFGEVVVRQRWRAGGTVRIFVEYYLSLHHTGLIQ